METYRYSNGHLFTVKKVAVDERYLFRTSASLRKDDETEHTTTEQPWNKLYNNLHGLIRAAVDILVAFYVYRISIRIHSYNQS